MSKRPFVSRFIDRANQTFLRRRSRKQVLPTYDIPAGAQPGDFSLEAGSFTANGYTLDAQQGIIYVPENRQQADGRLITLPLTITSAEVDEPGLPIYWCTTGPGSSNMQAAPPDWLLRRFPVVLVGYRGVDGSVHLDSTEIVKAQKGTGHNLHSAESLAQFNQAVRTATARWEAAGIDLASYSLAETAADLEAVRQALGHEQILLVGEGFGSRIAQAYAASYGEHVVRMALLAPTTANSLAWDAAQIERLLERYATLYERSASGDKPLTEIMNTALSEMPRNWRIFPIDPGKVRFMAFTLLFDRRNGALMLDTLKAAANGNPSGLAMMTILYDVVVNSSARGAVGDLLIKTYQDQELGSGEPGEFGLGSPLGKLLGAGRDAMTLPLAPVLDEIETETLLVSGNLDVAAPAGPVAATLIPKLRHHHHIIMRDAGHLTDLWRLQPDGMETLLNGFLRDGTVDDSELKYDPIDFTVSQNLAAMMKVLWRVVLLFIGSIVACIILVLLWQLLS